MQVMRDFVIGIFSVLKATSAPLLYRYPYRNSAEGLRKDWQNIGKDIDSVFGKIREASDGRQSDTD